MENFLSGKVRVLKLPKPVDNNRLKLIGNAKPVYWLF